MKALTLKKSKLETGLPFKNQAQKLGYSASQIEKANGLPRDSISSEQTKTVLNSTPDQELAAIRNPDPKNKELDHYLDQLKIGTKVYVDGYKLYYAPDGTTKRVRIKVLGRITDIQGDTATVEWSYTKTTPIKTNYTNLGSYDPAICFLEALVNIGNTLEPTETRETLQRTKKFKLKDLAGKNIVSHQFPFYKDVENKGILTNVSGGGIFTSNGDFYANQQTGWSNFREPYTLHPIIENKETLNKWALLPSEDGQYELIFVRNTLSNGELAVRTTPNPVPGIFSKILGSSKNRPDTERYFRSIPGDGLIFENTYQEGEGLQRKATVLVGGRVKAKVVGVFGDVVALRKGKAIFYAKTDEVRQPKTNGWRFW